LFEWVKSIIDEKGLVQQITCNICTSIKMKEKLFAPKLDSLLKHVGCRKAMVFMLGVDASSHYFNKNLVHGNNECEFFVVTAFLSWTNSKLMSSQNKNKNMCNFFPFITY
jgi:hypothetical protein